MNQILKRNILTGYLISVPTGLLTVFIVFAFPVVFTGEGLTTILLAETYGWAIIGLIISFLISIYFGSIKAHTKLTENNSLLSASFAFSLKINTVIWAAFVLLTIIKNFNYDLLLIFILPLLGFGISVIFTTFTLGLIISYIFNRNLKKQ